MSSRSEEAPRAGAPAPHSSPSTCPAQLEAILRETLDLLTSSAPSWMELRGEVRTGLAAVAAGTACVRSLLMSLCLDGMERLRAPSGRLDVRLERMFVSEDLALVHPQLNPGFYVRLSVSDNGVGRDETELERALARLAPLRVQLAGRGGALLGSSGAGVGATFDAYLPVAS